MMTQTMLALAITVFTNALVLALSSIAAKLVTDSTCYFVDWVTGSLDEDEDERYLPGHWITYLQTVASLLLRWSGGHLLDLDFNLMQCNLASIVTITALVAAIAIGHFVHTWRLRPGTLCWASHLEINRTNRSRSVRTPSRIAPRLLMNLSVPTGETGSGTQISTAADSGSGKGSEGTAEIGRRCSRWTRMGRRYRGGAEEIPSRLTLKMDWRDCGVARGKGSPGLRQVACVSAVDRHGRGTVGLEVLHFDKREEVGLQNLV